MNFHGIAQSARLYVRSEAMVAEILLKVYARKFVFATVGILALAMALAFLNLAAYLYLQSIWGPVWTPLAIGLANLSLAVICMLVAAFGHAGPELEVAKELRNISSQTLEDEFRASLSVGGLAGSLAGGSDSSIAKLLLPVVISIVTSLSRRKAAPRK